MARSSDRRSSALALVVALVLMVLVAGLWAFVFFDHRQASSAQASTSGSSAGSSSPGESSSSPSSESSSSDGDDGAAEGEGTLDQAREAFAADGSRVLVLGDETGDSWDEWAFLLAESQGLPGAMWMTQTENGYSGASEGTRLWSGAMTEATADYPVEHWDAMWPSTDPDLVLLSYGHHYSSADEATQSMEELRAAITEQAPETPIVVVLQNPQADDANASVREAIAGWAEESGLPTIDVAAAFAESDQAPENLRLDEMHPSSAGSQLWAETVEEALA
ncbi:SGNH/GDSL hydrolase family protein [Janibacter sp. DB-40]|uniref:SGNH/GDSL hydrolase family protein n=1 Tax=Janibacter sp. DB-40 TaxID=3028808 RepID=UPI00240512BD|nr:SGNH/GDSL hydrolase family protein [Janibacter sp. DB-40]